MQALIIHMVLQPHRGDINLEQKEEGAQAGRCSLGSGARRLGGQRRLEGPSSIILRATWFLGCQGLRWDSGAWTSHQKRVPGPVCQEQEHGLLHGLGQVCSHRRMCRALSDTNKAPCSTSLKQRKPSFCFRKHLLSFWPRGERDVEFGF